MNTILLWLLLTLGQTLEPISEPIKQPISEPIKQPISEPIRPIKQSIKFPTPVKQVIPTVITTNPTPIDLYQNQTLVIESDTPFLLVEGDDETSGLVNTEPAAGPIKFRGVFAPAPQNALTVTKQFNAKHLVFVDLPNAPATVTVITLLAIPERVTAKADIKRQTVRLMPATKPVPVPVPTPTPTPVPTPVVGDLRVILIWEASANNTEEQLNVLNSTKLVAFLKENTKEWRKWDQNLVPTNESAELMAIWNKTKPSITTLPAVIIIRGTTGKIEPLPKTVDELIALIKTY